MLQHCSFTTYPFSFLLLPRLVSAFGIRSEESGGPLLICVNILVVILAKSPLPSPLPPLLTKPHKHPARILGILQMFSWNSLTCYLDPWKVHLCLAFSFFLFLKKNSLIENTGFKKELHSSLHDNSISVNEVFGSTYRGKLQYKVKSHLKSADAVPFTAAVCISFWERKQQQGK